MEKKLYDIFFIQEIDLIKLFIERFDKLNHHYIVTGLIAEN